ncbi:hypothetical protein BZA02_112103 [Ruegeria sp. P4]|nr:hypothetical protein BZA02_112103 [Ruegeria sp. P4]
MSKTSTVKNPLTIIAIFAGLTEVGGTGVLPFLSSDAQSVYIWFLMIFPIFLVVLFFCTLNFNREVLYAPSDWSNEDNFFRKFSRASPLEKLTQVEAEIQEGGLDDSGEPVAEDELVETASKDESREQPATEAVPSSVAEAEVVPSIEDKFSINESDSSLSSKNSPKPKNAPVSAGLLFYRAVEEFGLDALAQTLNVDFQSNVRFSKGELSKTIFDGLALQGKTVHVAEVKYSKYGISPGMIARLKKELPKFRGAMDAFRDDRLKMVLHVVVVHDSIKRIPTDKQELDELKEVAKGYGISMRVYTARLGSRKNLEDLLTEY